MAKYVDKQKQQSNKYTSLDIEVHTTLTVPDETVKRCLTLVEMWLNDNPDKRIVGGTRNIDGTIDGFKIEDRDHVDEGES